MHLKNYSLVILLCLVLLFPILVGFNILERDLNQTEGVLNLYSTSQLHQATAPILNTFPVDLDLLFWEDNLTIQNQKLDTIGNSSFGWMMTPWGGYFTSTHVEGAPKWYFYAGRRLAVSAPYGGTLTHHIIRNASVVEYNGTELIKDISITYHMGMDYYIRFDHLYLLKTIFDVINSTNSYTFIDGEFIGYTDPNWALDFHYKYKYCDICPFPYLSTELQANLTSLYNLQYERAMISGVYPEAKICLNMSIETENTIWGPWRYSTGPYNSYSDVFGYTFGGLTFLNRNCTDAVTFYKNPIEPSENLSESIVGIFRDNEGANNIPEYNKTGYGLVELVVGNFSQGILRLILEGGGDWGSSNTTIYARFLVDIKGIGFEDDTLTIEYYSTLLEAQSGFTSDNIIYTRISRCNPGASSDIPFSKIVYGLLVLYCITIIWSRKKHATRKDI